tara:strand:- start:15457 stop:15600 length:144 start_codon:yes stop_codon:yes gene_type:complete
MFVLSVTDLFETQKQPMGTSRFHRAVQAIQTGYLLSDIANIISQNGP